MDMENSMEWKMERKFWYGIWKMLEWNGMEDFKNEMEDNLPYFHTNLQRWAKRNQKRKVQLPQPPPLRKLRRALIFYFETLRKLRCGLKPLKFVAH